MRALAVVTLLFGMTSCTEIGRSCTEMGCADQASLSLRPASGEWPAGEYALSVTVDGTERRCAFNVPADLPEPRSARSLCEPALPLYIQPETTCTEHRDRDSVSQSCTPIPQRYWASLTLYGTPSAVSVVLERDGTPVLDEALTLRYQAARPNGPGCEPLCHQASANLEF